MPRTVRFPIVAAAIVAVMLSATATTATAQGASQVRAGSEVAVSNSGECVANTDVVLYFEGGDSSEIQVGSAVSDDAGSFEATVTIPAEAVEGPAAILVACGLDSALLTYDLEVIGSGFSLGSLVGPVLMGLAVIAIIGLVALLRRRRNHDDATEDHAGSSNDADGSDDDAELVVGDDAEPVIDVPERQPMAMAAVAPSEPAADPSVPTEDPTSILAPGASATIDTTASPVEDRDHDERNHEDGGVDDGADYWFWEAATSAGPRRRVACMTETTFHLHEISVEAFQSMLDHLVEVGPDVALAQAFVRIPVLAIDRVVREGTVVHIEGRSASGPRRQTIDLADGADGVVEMLARRLSVVDERQPQDSAR